MSAREFFRRCLAFGRRLLRSRDVSSEIVLPPAAYDQVVSLNANPPVPSVRLRHLMSARALADSESQREDEEDLALVDARRDEPTTAWEAIKARLGL
jgi:hypothetical protein